MQLLLFTPRSSPRLEYSVSTLLSALGLDTFQTTTHQGAFKSFNGPKINYSLEQIEQNEFHLKPVDLLLEDDIKPQPLNCFSWNNVKAFYKTEGHFFNARLSTLFLLMI
jgi:hypothetical protein